MELYKHNKVTYEKAIEILDRTHRVAIIQATGTGKSFITMKLFQDYFIGYKKLYIVPKNSIADSIQMYDEWDSKDVVFTTYQNLLDCDEDQLLVYCKVFDVILCDEFHHAGAAKWSKSINIFAEHANYLIGLSATNIRYLDSQRDMAKELFGTNVVKGPDLREAIELGILPSFRYVSLLYDTREFLERCERMVDSTDIESKSKIERMRLSEDGSYELGVRLRKYLDPSNKKWVLFCSSIDQMDGIEIDIKNWFNTDNISIYKLHSKLSRNAAVKTLSDFSNQRDLSITVTVDMLNEGVHVDGVTGIIMLRKTKSAAVFLQQLGRALSASNKDITPIIIDAVENYDNMSTMTGVCRDIIPRNLLESNAIEGKEMFIVDDSVIEADDLLNSILNFQKKYDWKIWQDRLITENYPTSGPSMYTMIPGITKKMCVRRARELGVRFRRNWTEEEDIVIKRYYPHEGRDVAKRLEGRTPDSCVSRASTLGVRYKGRWDINCDMTLLKYFPFEREKCFERLPEFTEKECRKHAAKLGLF